MDIKRMEKLLASEIEAGKKVKEVREVIKTHDIQKQDMSIESSKLFKPITKKLESITPKKIKRQPKKAPDYGVDPNDEWDEMDVDPFRNIDDELFGNQVLPKNEKQIPEKPPEYTDVTEIDYGMDEADIKRDIINKSGIVDNYETIEEIVYDDDLSYEDRIKYLQNNMKKAKKYMKSLNGKRLVADNRIKGIYKKKISTTEYNDIISKLKLEYSAFEEYINAIEMEIENFEKLKKTQR